MGNGKAQSVLEYLDMLVEKGKATNGAIKPLKISFVQVLKTVDGDKWESTNIRDIDADDYMNRFANLTMGKYNPESLTTYKSRLVKVVKWYVQFLDNPGWMPNVPMRDRATKTVTKKALPTGKPSSTDQRNSQPVQITPQSMPDVAKASDRILYPFPLSDGQLVHVSLPVKLTKSDAKRIGAFIESIAIEELSSHE